MDAITALSNIESLLISSSTHNVLAARNVLLAAEPNLSSREKPIFDLLGSHLDALELANHPTVITLTLALICQAELLLLTNRH